MVFDQWRLLTDALVSLLKTVAVLSALKCRRIIETEKKNDQCRPEHRRRKRKSCYCSCFTENYWYNLPQVRPSSVLSLFFPSGILLESKQLQESKKQNRSYWFSERTSQLGQNSGWWWPLCKFCLLPLSAHDKWHIPPFAVLTLSGNLNHLICCFSTASITQNGIFFFNK